MSLPVAKPKVPAILRPNSGSSGHATMIWVPGVELVELVYQGGELKYATWDGHSVSYQKSHGQLTPPQWVANAVKKRTVQLPSEAISYDSLDDLAGAMKAFVHSYFECDERMEYVAVLYALLTWIYDRFKAVPYLRLLGTWGTGKSRATEVIGNLCYRPVALSGSSSPAALYRLIEPIGGTLMIDEADFSNTQMGTDIAKNLNSGYQDSGFVWRAEKNTAREFIPTAYNVYGPKIINGRRPFHDYATESRCLTYRPNKRTRTDVPVQLPLCFEEEALALRNQLLDWRLRKFEAFDSKQPADICTKLERLGIKLQPRTLQICGPLLVIATRLRNAPQYLRHLIEYALFNESQSLEVLKDSVEAMVVVRAYIARSKEGDPTCGEIAMEVRELHEGEDPELARTLSPRTVGDTLRGLGFQTRHGSRGTIVSIDPIALRNVCKQFGIEDESAK